MRYILIFLLAFNSINLSNAQDVKDRLTIEEKSFTSASGQKVMAEVGSLEVPENRNNPNSKNISIHFIRLKSTNPNPKTPLIYLEGGPGSSATWQAGNKHYLEKWLPYLELNDVILLDQRGTGAGTERVLYIWRKNIPENIFSDPEVTKQHFESVGNEALVDFKKREVDLNGYTTVENAKDIDALRKALGYEKISLLGFSYGTHLGQAYIRYYDKYVQNAILVGVEGPNHTFKLPLAMDIQFQKIALLAKEDTNVSREVPDLIALYKRVCQKLDKKPITVEVISPLTNSPMKVKVSSYGLNLMLRFDIGDASDIPVFPRLLYSIDQGDYSMLQWFVQKRIRVVFGVHGMSATMDAASGASSDRIDRIKKENEKSMFKNIANFSMGTFWPAPDLGEEFRAPLSSNTRTLFMSGTLDFNTPPHQAEEVRWGFSNSNHIIVKGAGHEQILTHPEAEKTIIRFLKGENVDDVALFYPRLQFIPIKGDTGELWHPSMGERSK
ncbi:alpha/beta fold hydrolase [Aquimarina sp. 2201CG14-23]|uniref:alpha/beta fold hydrolase n=1 Tax=Aquimarina mycalae TaxID=3040073 RepID=UPI002477E33B|nr:alpha/beta fold hydrolase [Aquimarina sp. 2201CG14-23]MDH7447110.1 alpha/beta fold hydrolase [Aquimarina sp. 2201CG14-23]